AGCRAAPPSPPPARRPRRPGAAGNAWGNLGIRPPITPSASPGAVGRRRLRPVLSPPEMDEEPPEVLGVLLDAMVERLDLLLLQEPEHPLLELPRALARDDLHERGLLRHRLVDDRLQGPVDVLPTVVDVVQVELQLHGAVLRSRAASTV